MCASGAWPASTLTAPPVPIPSEVCRTRASARGTASAARLLSSAATPPGPRPRGEAAYDTAPALRLKHDLARLRFPPRAYEAGRGDRQGGRFAPRTEVAEDGHRLGFAAGGGQGARLPADVGQCETGGALFARPGGIPAVPVGTRSAVV